MTRSIIVFRDRNGDVLLVIFINHDGYPEGIGSKLAHSLLAPAENGECLFAQAASILALDSHPTDSSSDEGYADYYAFLPAARAIEPIEPMLLDYAFTVRPARVQASEEDESQDGQQTPTITVLQAPFGQDSDADEILTPTAFLRRYREDTTADEWEGELDELWEAHVGVWEAASSLPVPFPHWQRRIALQLCYLETADAEAVLEGDHILSLRLDGAAWSDYLADELPKLIRDGIHDEGAWAAELLVHLKRGPGRVSMISPHELDDSVTSTIRICFDKSSPHDVHIRATKPQSAPYVAKMVVSYKTELQEFTPDDPAHAATAIFGPLFAPTIQTRPPAADLNRTMQPALDGLADYHRPVWTPETHLHFPKGLREHTFTLMLVAKALSRRFGHGLEDPWRTLVLPEALKGYAVRRDLSRVKEEDDSGDELGNASGDESGDASGASVVDEEEDVQEQVS